MPWRQYSSSAQSGSAHRNSAQRGSAHSLSQKKTFEDDMMPS